MNKWYGETKDDLQVPSNFKHEVNFSVQFYQKIFIKINEMNMQT